MDSKWVELFVHWDTIINQTSGEASPYYMASKVITTRDGSRSLFSNRFQQHYHNIAGALTESRNVFFDNTGLSRALAEHRDITLCEVGLGTGLHVALVECMRKRTGSRSQVHYYSVEKYPLEVDVIRQMDFGRICPGMEEVVVRLADDLYQARDGESVTVTISPDGKTEDGKKEGEGEGEGEGKGKAEAEAEAETEGKGEVMAATEKKPTEEIAGLLETSRNAEEPEQADTSKNPLKSETQLPVGTPFTRVEVFRGDFHDWNLAVFNRPAQIILHDAFSPDTNPDLWTVATFRKLMEAADPQAMLGTYCSATRARAAMILAGWHIGRVQGPPGKREVTVASPDEAMLSAFRGVNEELLMNRFREELS